MPLFVNKSYFFLYSVTDPSHFSLIVLVLLVTKHSRSSFNVLIKGTTVISNPCYFVLWLYVEKINPYLRTFSDDCVRLIREDSVLAASREHEGICISWCLCSQQSLAMCSCPSAAPCPKCLRFRSKAKCPAKAPLGKTLHSAQPQPP